MTSPLYLEMSPVVTKLRLYDKPGGYAERTPYIATLDVMWKTRTEVWLAGAESEGEIDLQVWTLAMTLLRKEGVEIVRFERHGIEKTYHLNRQRKEPDV